MTTAVKKNGSLQTIGSVSNAAADDIAQGQPYLVEVTLQGTAPLLLHGWNVDAVAEKSAAGKGSKQKKEDNLESYVSRNDKGQICIPGEYIRQSLIHAAKFRQDPRSPRKSAMDLFKAGVLVEDELCSLGSKDWQYLDRRRAVIQRNAITRVRPAFAKGWKVNARLGIILPEWIPSDAVLESLTMAGRVVGLADFRPTFGRFAVTSFQVRPYV